MNKNRRIDFKSLSKLEQNIIYEYNAKVYEKGLENATKFHELQKSFEDGIIFKFNKRLSEESIKKIRIYIEDHRKY